MDNILSILSLDGIGISEINYLMMHREFLGLFSPHTKLVEDTDVLMITVRGWKRLQCWKDLWIKDAFLFTK